MRPFCAAVDWGTTSFRLWLLDRGGNVLAERRGDEGLMVAMERGFGDVLERHLAAAGAPETLPAVLCGMVGARQGWREAVYLDAPAKLEDIPAHAVAVEHARREVRILPGVAQRRSGYPDVMRGEETKLLGAGQGHRADGLVCIPGTHSKWVRLHQGRLEEFHTSMTGDAFAALSRHTVLRLTLADDAEVDPADPVFSRAVLGASERPQEALFRAFSIRPATLLGTLPDSEAAASLSGLLIGLEIAGARSRFGAFGQVTLIAMGRFAALYDAALTTAGIAVEPVDADDAVRSGLFDAASRLWPEGSA